VLRLGPDFLLKFRCCCGVLGRHNPRQVENASAVCSRMSWLGNSSLIGDFVLQDDFFVWFVTSSEP